MAWSPLATQFCLELAFGVLLGLCLLPKAPLGLFFFRLMGATAVLPLLVAALVPPLFAQVPWTSPVTLSSLAAALAFPLLSGPVRSGRRLGASLWASAWTGVALFWAVQQASELAGPGQLALGTLVAMGTGVVAGGVGLAMVVGHWYLTVPQLPIRLLKTMNRFTAVAMIITSMLLALTLLWHQGTLAANDQPLLSSFGLFYLAARVAMGLAMPLLFAWMTAGSLAHSNTRSATGILYASTVLVLIGAAVSLSLQDRYGIPL